MWCPRGAWVLACAAACRDDWEEAAELVGAAAGTLMDDTAGFFHLSMVRDQMVRPHLDAEVFAAATARGARSDVPALLAAHGV